MKTQNTVIATENATVLDNAMLFAFVINDKTTSYHAVVDSMTADSRACRDDYLHIYRHDTANAQNRAHNNVFQCYLKQSKNVVNVLCNKVNFDAFQSDIEHVKQYKSNSLIRFVVAYDCFVSFMLDLIQYDSNRATTTATATAEATAEAK